MASKKVWISVAVLGVILFALLYGWFYSINHLLAQAERMARQVQKEQHMTQQWVGAFQEAAQQSMKLVKGQVKETAAPAAAGEKDRQDQAVTFPCYVRMKEDEVGIYSEDEALLRRVRQTGELLGSDDRIQLIQGIRVENERELTMLFESYHWQ